MSYRSSTTALPSSKKTHSEQHKQILKQLLREDENKQCADCKLSKNPRWASWSLGCFICIRCSGIHRSMGTHISKVKSVDLDAWTDDQIENMVKWGNKKANSFWEDKLPDNYIPDQSKIENFIRTKYDLKKWASSSTIPNPSTIKIQNHNNNNTTKNNNSLLHTEDDDDDFGHFNHAKVVSPHKRSSKLAPAPTKTVLPPAPLSASTTPTPPPPSSSSPFGAASVPLPARGSSQQIQSAQSTGGSMTSNSGRPDLKKSILSLYSSPSASNSFIQQSQRQQQQPQQQQGGFDNMNSLSNSLSGLNFQSATTRSNTTSTTNTPPPQQQAQRGNGFGNQAWANEWSDSSSSLPKNNVTTTSLDDDLFKNVWD
ncbi:hypothetical protein G210_3482 [Candida maltosa Xu316]|uniref:Arf-GAP domain-containing protein n=1 Tax=Candida maltosa (strain Xu316) TaxID=1245528 RepID=M3IIT1_CANMX|nr:hypothetical protein G210_3482 [Candida maltosa Xu316]